MLVILLAIFVIIFFAVTTFLAKELLKKFHFHKQFVDDAQVVKYWHYNGKKKPGMYNIVIESDRKFSVLIGFVLKIGKYEGVDWYSFASSQDGQKVVFSTFLGRGSCDFVFLFNSKNDSAKVRVAKEEEKLVPQVSCRPHWWQKLGFYG
ncbi:MAG TPA: hypothetical protein GX706_02340 [Candidatus Moranbacteria bacterium]|nr:hypothetical protein [Candidatus Moranbacteria bacterium]